MYLPRKKWQGKCRWDFRLAMVPWGRSMAVKLVLVKRFIPWYLQSNISIIYINTNICICIYILYIYIYIICINIYIYNIHIYIYTYTHPRKETSLVFFPSYSPWFSQEWCQEAGAGHRHPARVQSPAGLSGEVGRQPQEKVTRSYAERSPETTTGLGQFKAITWGCEPHFFRWCPESVSWMFVGNKISLSIYNHKYHKLYLLWL